jgi:hypothetical protein
MDLSTTSRIYTRIRDMTDPTKDEAISVRPVLQRLSRKIGSTISVGSLLRDWADLTRQVEIGYELTIYDYANDLAVRDHLQEVLRAATGPFADRLAQRVSIIDERYRSASREVTRPIHGPPVSGLGWWWFRVPLRMGEELRSDIGGID